MSCSLITSWHVAGSYAWTATTLNIQLHWVDWLTSASLEIVFPEQGTPSLAIIPHNTGNKIQILTK